MIPLWIKIFGGIFFFFVIISYMFELTKISDEEANQLFEKKKLTDEEVNNLLNKFK